jgi:hypothetical protein
MVRCIGCAALGAVDVLGGAEKVRVPRDPELLPPPMRASADDTASINGSATDKTIAIARLKLRVACENLIMFPRSPAGGSSL